MVRPDRPGLSRRDLLGLAAASATGLLAGCQALGQGSDAGSVGSSSPCNLERSAKQSAVTVEEYSRHDIPFRRAVDVTVAGADPTGATDVTPVIEPLMRDGTLLVFPEGRYRVDTPIEVPEDRVGLVGDGDARLLPTANVPQQFLDVDGVDAFVFRGLDVDVNGQPLTGMHVKVPTKFYIEDVEYLGRGGLSGQAFNLAVSESRGTGVVDGVTVRRGGRPDRYDSGSGTPGNGRIGVWAGANHRGTLRFVNSEFSEFGNNGLYTSRTPGKVQVIDSYFENNNVCAVRISGAGSYVEGCEVVVDFDRYDGPELSDLGTGFNPRAIMIDGGAARDIPPKDAGAEIRDCRIVLGQVPEEVAVQSAIEQNPVAQSLTITNTTVRVDHDGTPAIRRGLPGAGGWTYRPGREVPPEPHWLRVEDSTFTGSAAGGPTILLNGADGSRVRNCEIDQPGAGRDGIVSRDTADLLVEGGSLRAGNFPLVVQVDADASPGCRLRFAGQPTLTAVESHEDLAAFGDVPADGGCVLDGSDDRLGGGWRLNVAGIANGALLGMTGDGSTDGSDDG